MRTVHSLARARATLAAAVIAPCGVAHAGEAFHDSFATLDRERWYLSDGWTNGSHQGCIWKRGEVDVANGTLRLRITPREATTASGEPREAVCAEVQTRKAFGHGLYEVSLRVAHGSGIVTAFFTYTGPVHGNPHDEIDIELLGRAPRRVDTNYFTDGDGDHAHRVPLSFRTDTDFTRYAFEWTEDAIRWYVEGELVREVRAEDLPDAGLPATSQRIFLSLWNGTERLADWLGPTDADRLPALAEVDYVAFTPPGERCLFPRSISCREDWGADEAEEADERS